MSPKLELATDFVTIRLQDGDISYLIQAAQLAFHSQGPLMRYLFIFRPPGRVADPICLLIQSPGRK